ncbi:MAG: hypothetical protein M0P95_10470 [Sulfuritalea sp.]|nr:hypothetical protein [Sulfuritalea sp.]
MFGNLISKLGRRRFKDFPEQGIDLAEVQALLKCGCCRCCLPELRRKRSRVPAVV